ncbi:unnamed protein product [Clonostachys rosea f. rosea IK726]|uniref:Fe2OG dioxygenase domain-containing protein n=3 Tax=Bionectria ochroleuca TaxID=29856 RepID=A0A0B7K859_BIOOC|nr:unnamed protein product [Clonostachys rosea f. rosea IK726]CAG9951257.1 unnamed protein product [Clonostachys rosea f. rosea IK726]
MASSVLQIVSPIKGAPKPIGPTNKKPMRPSNQLPQSLLDAARAIEKVPFHAEKHVTFQPPSRVYTMKEIGLEGCGISPIATSEPFQLFSQEAVQQCRAEIFSEPVLDKYQFSSTFTKNMIRGISAEDAPFVHALWKSPQVANAVSKVAGIELVPAFDYEIAHVNVLVNKDGEGEKAEDNVGFSWHYDSFPFVCVTMLSDCAGMTGGETALRTGDGEVRKVRGPTMGTAVILQGRYIEHAALKALGGQERTTMITPFRPKNPLIKDETVLTTCVAISDNSRLFYDYCLYRAELLQERMRLQAQWLREQKEAGAPFDTASVKKFIEEQREFLDTTLEQFI